MLRATQVVVEEGLAQPLLIGRPSVIETRLERFGLSIRPGRDFTLINPDDDPRYREYVQAYVEAAGRRGITPDAARTIVRTNATVIAALAVRLKLADAMICGLEGRYMAHLKNIRDVIGLAPGVDEFAALSLVITNKGAYFLADTQVTPDPSAEAIAEMAVLAAAHVRRFGLQPKIALLSHSDFGSYDSASPRKMRAALRPAAGAPSGAGGRRRDERRHRAQPRDPRAGVPAFAAEGRGQCADHAQSRCRQHRLSDDQGAGGCAARSDRS